MYVVVASGENIGGGKEYFGDRWDLLSVIRVVKISSMVCIGNRVWFLMRRSDVSGYGVMY